jgi:tetratricopeptide (TPR) repeat protein
MFTESQRLAGLPPDLVRVREDIVKAILGQRLEAAAQGVIAALARAPTHPELLRLSALVQLGQRNSEGALASLLMARAAQPDDPLIHDALGTAYETVHDFSRARAALHRACILDPANSGYWFNYANRLFEGGDHAGSLAAARRALALDPSSTDARGLLATLATAAGRHDEARDYYRAIIRDDPAGAGMTWWWYATMKPMPLTDADMATMRSVVDDPAVPANKRALAGFALAIALEHKGRIAEAFAQLRGAHALLREFGGPYDIAAVSRHVDEILQAFDPVPSGAGVPQGKEAIFVVSLPRSGSTLTEQILASHSQVSGGGELPDFLQIVIDESDRRKTAFPGWVKSQSPEQWRMLGQRYLARTRRFRTERPRFTDKRLDNWMMTGAILAALPDARVVVVRRDPLENCLACYRYMVTHDFTHSFADLAEHWRNFDRAVTRWKALYPDRVHVQVYEDLIAEPEAQIRKLLEFCDLPFEEACLNFHKTERYVATPSATQVREPIRRDTARAQTYGALLDPLRAELGLPPFQPEIARGSQ